MNGIFDRGASQPLQGRRRRRLDQLRWYPEPAALAGVDLPAADLLDRVDDWRSPLERGGAVKVRLDRALGVLEFIEVGRVLGELVVETAPAVQPFVEERVVLNLRNDLRTTPDTNLQPFAENAITLHT